jgi:ubiquinone/menaquinone biosynthesis C-methylase UbiE
MMLADFADIADDGPVLDVGCGTGALAAEVAGRNSDRQVIGIDVSEPYLDFARKRHGAANLRFRRADATALPFADGEFVASLAQLVLNFVPDALGVAREMARVTRAGGVAAATVGTFVAASSISASSGTQPAQSIRRQARFGTDFSPTHSLSQVGWRGSGRRRGLLVRKWPR